MTDDQITDFAQRVLELDADPARIERLATNQGFLIVSRTTKLEAMRILARLDAGLPVQVLSLPQ
jgi:hypothetical protein